MISGGGGIVVVVVGEGCGVGDSRIKMPWSERAFAQVRYHQGTASGSAIFTVWVRQWCSAASRLDWWRLGMSPGAANRSKVAVHVVACV